MVWGIVLFVIVIVSFGSNPLNSGVDLASILLAVIFAAAVGVFFGLYPAARASKLGPVEALRSE